MLRLSLVLVLCLSATSANAVDLAAMQAMALGNREIVQLYMTRLEQSHRDIDRAKSGYYPSVDLGYTANVLDDSSMLEYRRNAVAIGRVSWNLFSGFSRRYGLQSAEIERQIAEFRLQGIRQDLQLNVALAYLTVYDRHANRRVAEAAFQTLARVYQDGENRYQVGLIGKNELLKFRVDYDNANITLQAADASLQTSINQLSREIGAPVSLADLDFAEFTVLPSLVDRAGHAEIMLAERSEIKALEAVQAAAGSRSEVVKSEYYPKVDLVGSYRRYDDELISGTGSEDDDELRGQLVLSMNLFQGFNTEATLAKARLEERAVGYELEELKQTLLTELDNLVIGLRVSLDNVEVSLRSIEQAEENLRITQLKYQEGLERESDLLNAITSLSRAQYNHVAVVRTVFNDNYNLIRLVDGFNKG